MMEVYVVSKANGLYSCEVKILHLHRVFFWNLFRWVLLSTLSYDRDASKLMCHWLKKINRNSRVEHPITNIFLNHTRWLVLFRRNLRLNSDWLNGHDCFHRSREKSSCRSLHDQKSFTINIRRQLRFVSYHITWEHVRFFSLPEESDHSTDVAPESIISFCAIAARCRVRSLQP